MKLKYLLIAFLSLFLHNGLNAQMIADNSKWTYEAKHKPGTANSYQLILHLKLPDKWHIYSLKPGGDGMEIAPSFTFTKNGKLILDGDIKEKGKLISEKLEGIDGIVNMFKGNVDYIQEAEVAGNTTIKGTYSYQICNDQMCLPPVTKPFAIVIKDNGGGEETKSTVPINKTTSDGPVKTTMIADSSKWTFDAKRKVGTRDGYDLFLHLKLPQKWHIYSLKPGGDGMEPPPEFTFTKNDKVRLSGEMQEHGKLISKEMVAVDGIVNMFEGDVDYVQEATIGGNTIVEGTYTYQICTDQLCLQAVTKHFSIVIDTSKLETGNTNGSSHSDGVNKTDNSVKSSNSEIVVKPGNEQKNNIESKSLLVVFVLALGGGIAAVFTPCIFSMIPITVSFFTKRSKSRKEGIRNALYYSLSIISIFTILGVLISAVFGSTALNSLSTNWIANLVFFIIFVIFGISFLGAFEITLPSSWTSATDSKAGTGSFAGIFFMALTLVIVSFSCTGPIVGPLLVLAGKGGIAGPALGMFGFSLGLALPFALFAIFPGLLNKMAQSGGWLNQVKVVLGFIELMLALKFLSNADLAQGWRLLDREIFIAIWIVLSVLLGFYLLDKLKLSHDDATPKNIYGQEYVSIFKLLLAMISFSFAVYLLPGMWGAPLNGASAFIPPMGTFDAFAGYGGGSAAGGNEKNNELKPQKYVSDMKIYEPPVVTNLGLVTFFDYEEALAASKKFRKPIMLDFTGINCVNCRKMEFQVWSKPEVAKLLKEDFIVVSLYCDINRIELPKNEQYFSKDLNSQVVTLGNKNADLQASKFGSNSQPYYFYVDENGTKLADEGYAYDPDAQKFVEHLEKVKSNYKKLHP